VNGRSSGLCLFTAAIAVVTLAFSAGPALAAPAARSGAQVHSTVGPQASVSPQEATITSTSSSSSVSNAAATSAAEKCETYTVTVFNKDVLGIILFSFHMVTYFCWNNLIVTYHDTSVGAGVTGTGTATGWEYTGDNGIDFYCYKAGGSTRNCSGNSESSTGAFYNFLLGEHCSDFINQFENYKGQTNYHWSSNCQT